MKLTSLFSTNEVGKVYVAYNEFQSAISFNSNVKTLLPLSLELSEKEKLQEEFPFDFKYEPSPSEILDSLLQRLSQATFGPASLTHLPQSMALEWHRWIVRLKIVKK